MVKYQQVYRIEKLILCYYHFQIRSVFSLKCIDSSRQGRFPQLLEISFDICQLHFVFYKQQVYKQLALGWKVAKKFSALNPLSIK